MAWEHHVYWLPVWYRLILISAVQRMLFQKWSVFVRCFLSKSGLDCRLWQWHDYLLGNVLLLAGCCESFFFTTERILQLSTAVVLCEPLGLFVAELTSFFPKMYQTVDLATPNVPAISLMDLLCFWSLTIVVASGLLSWGHFISSDITDLITQILFKLNWAGRWHHWIQ